MSLERAIQKLAKAIQAPPNPNMAPDEPGGVDGGIKPLDIVLNVRCKTRGIRLQEGGPFVQHCICRAKGYMNGCILKITQGYCTGQDKTGWTERFRLGQEGPPCLPTPPGLLN